MIVRILLKRDDNGDGAKKQEDPPGGELNYEAVFENIYRKLDYQEKRCKLANVAKVTLVSVNYKPLMNFPGPSADVAPPPPLSENDDVSVPDVAPPPPPPPNDNVSVPDVAPPLLIPQEVPQKDEEGVSRRDPKGLTPLDPLIDPPTTGEEEEEDVEEDVEEDEEGSGDGSRQRKTKKNKERNKSVTLKKEKKKKKRKKHKKRKNRKADPETK